MGGLPVTGALHGQALDLSYAQPVGHHGTIVGVSYIPFDSSSVALTSPQLGSITDGSAWTTGGARVGVLQSMPHGLRIGADYSYQAGAARATFLAPTLPPALVTQSARTITRNLIIGVSLQASPRVQCFGSYSNTLPTGGTLENYNGETVTGGVHYLISPALATQVTTTGKSNTASLYWKTRYGMYSATYAHNPLPSADSYLGSGHSLAGMVDLAF